MGIQRKFSPNSTSKLPEFSLLTQGTKKAKPQASLFSFQVWQILLNQHLFNSPVTHADNANTPFFK